MNDWVELKSRARKLHSLLLDKAEGNYTADALLAAAESETGIKRSPCPKGDSLLMGAEAVLDIDANLIFYDQDVDPLMAVFYQMHEYAHHYLHNETYVCTQNELDPEASEEESSTALVKAYNPKERAEREANVFAREILLPSNALRQWFIKEGKKASEIASLVGVPEGMVLHQLTFALLVSNLVIDTKNEKIAEREQILDESQQEVAEWHNGPLLVEAGPGTGKTRTLVSRVEALLKQGVPPSSILALTFSNKAAEEMRSRVAIVSPDAAINIWMGTFHAFGLEIIRKFGSYIDVKPDFKVIDPVDAMFVLESNLISFDLVHYRNLYDPTLFLPDILMAISRAKDELIGPAEYRGFAEKMRSTASEDDEIVAAEKALEVAKVYEFYQNYIENESILDFGDLISRSVTLLTEHDAVKAELRSTYTHVLVDEYQDVNRASGVFLRELAGNGDNLWVVGDRLQSIYRFRGAAPANMTLFAKDFPGAQTKALNVNYRSLPTIVNVFSKLAQDMRANSGQSFTAWKTYRNVEDGSASLSVADSLDREVEGIANEIRRLHSKGMHFYDQAILCRSHTVMAKIAGLLEELGIPILYLGDVFEREEIRDLLSLVSLNCEGDGRGLVRVARFPEYDIPLKDVLVLLAAAREKNIFFPKALVLAEELDDISEKGKHGLALLMVHIKDMHYGKDAWSMLVHYLFNNSNYLVRISDDESLATQQKRLAIYQFLQFAHQERTRKSGGNENRQRRFLNYIRRLEIQGADKVLRQVPDWAAGLDAVRLLTVHASKGLEFAAVYIPYLGKGKFPASKKTSVCPPPSGMLSAIEAESHDEEEECLFFVAVSRARDHLSLSRSRRYGNSNSNESEIIAKLSGTLSLHSIGAESHSQAKITPVEVTENIAKDCTQSFDVRDLETHLKCPKKYFYERVLSLGRRLHDNSGYLSFHQAVYRVLLWLKEERLRGNTICESSAARELESAWMTSGLQNHPYEKIYKENAESMVSLAVQRFSQAGKFLPTPEWEVLIQNGRVRIVPDLLEESSNEAGLTTQVHVLRFRTGRPTKAETDKDIYAIYQTAVEKALGRNGKMKVLYLSTGEIVDVDLTSRKMISRIEKFESAITGIQKGISTPNPNERECPRCPHYFICSIEKNA